MNNLMKQALLGYSRLWRLPVLTATAFLALFSTFGGIAFAICDGAYWGDYCATDYYNCSACIQCVRTKCAISCSFGSAQYNRCSSGGVSVCNSVFGSISCAGW